MESIERLEKRIDRALKADDPAQVAMLIDCAVAHPDAADLYVPELYEQLGAAWRAAGRYNEAITAMERAIEAGWSGKPDMRSEIAELHLLAGRDREAEELWARVKSEDPDDVWLYNHAGLSYGDVGRHEQALGWLGEGLELALRTDDPERVIDQLLALRDRSLRSLDREPGELDERGREFLAAPKDEAAERRARDRQIAAYADAWRDGEDVPLEEPDDFPVEMVERGAGFELAVGWFPEPDYLAALERWDSLRELWAAIDHRQYCRRMEATLRGWSRRGLRPKLVELQLQRLLPWCAERDLDPDEARAHFAADELRRGNAASWPPGRNEPCWCGSGAKYKKCCGTVSARATHPLHVNA